MCGRTEKSAGKIFRIKIFLMWPSRKFINPHSANVENMVSS